MTRRISITLPDEVAQRLDQEENASAYIADAIRQRVRRETLREVLIEAGYQITADGKEKMRRRLYDAEARRAAHRTAAA
jgi:predicted transcriptional regulator